MNDLCAESATHACSKRNRVRMFKHNFMSRPDWFFFFFLMNPLGKVPVIELPGGKVLYESAIVVSNRHEEWKCVGKKSFKRSKLDL